MAVDVPLLLSYYEGKLSLLLRISQTRLGASYVINAGLIQAVQESGLFAVDPDLGIGRCSNLIDPGSWLRKTEIDNPNALKKYYELLLSIIRVISSVVLSKGPQNELVLEQVRNFLISNRPSMVAVFKRHAKIGGVLVVDTSSDLSELVESYMLLITMTNFLEVSFTTTTISAGTSVTQPWQFEEKGVKKLESRTFT